MPNITCIKIDRGSDDWNYFSNSNNWISDEHQQQFTKDGGTIWRYMGGYTIKLSTQPYDFLPVTVDTDLQTVFYIHSDRLSNMYMVGSEYLTTNLEELTYTEMLKELNQ